MRFALSSILFVMLIGLVEAQTTKPADVPTDSAHRKVHPATQPGQVLEMSIPELGNFDFDAEAKDPQIPDDVKALNGVQIKLHGFMIPMDGASISKFALVKTLARSDWDRSAPKIQEVIVATCPPGKSVKYCPDEIVVQGKLKVGIVKDEGFIVQVFAVEDASVTPAAK